MREFLLAITLALLPLQPAPVVWGGEHIEMQITARGATIEFDCAHGAFDGTLKTDSKGHFAIAGTFSPEHAGPTRDDGPPPLAATYAGTIKDDAMSLQVTVRGQEIPVMTFELVRGRAGSVRKCR
jgi:hypothetical protein